MHGRRAFRRGRGIGKPLLPSFRIGHLMPSPCTLELTMGVWPGTPRWRTAPLTGIQQFVAIQLHSYPSNVLLSNHVECVVGARFRGEGRLSLGSLLVLGGGTPALAPMISVPSSEEPVDQGTNTQKSNASAN